MQGTDAHTTLPNGPAAEGGDDKADDKALAHHDVVENGDGAPEPMHVSDVQNGVVP